MYEFDKIFISIQAQNPFLVLNSLIDERNLNLSDHKGKKAQALGFYKPTHCWKRNAHNFANSSAYKDSEHS